MKKIHILYLVTTYLMSLQPAVAENNPTILAPQIICGDADPIFSYANANLSIALRAAKEMHPDNTFFTSTYQISPVITVKKDNLTSQTVMTRNFVGCAALNYISEADMISNNNPREEVSMQICGDKFYIPNVAVNLLNVALQNNATPNKHIVISSFNIESALENNNNDLPNSVDTWSFRACASVIISN